MEKFQKEIIPIFNRKEIVDICSIFVAISLSFIAFHELCHIVHGHNYLTSRHGESYRKERGVDFDPNQLMNLDWRTLEMDADAFAARKLLERISYLTSQLSGQIDRLILLDPSLPPLVLKEDLIRHWILRSIFSSFFVFERIEDNVTREYDQRKHPAFSERNDIGAYLENAGEGPYATLAKMASMCADRVMFPSTKQDGYDYINDNLVSAYRSGLYIKNWPNLLPYLKRLAWHPDRLAPAQVTIQEALQVRGAQTTPSENDINQMLSSIGMRTARS